MDVGPPKVLRNPLVVPYQTILAAGPANSSPRVLHALGQPTLGPMNQKTFEIMDDIKEGIRYVFQTRNELTLAVSATGHGGMEAVLCNLLEKGDKIIVAINGFWGERAADMASRYGANVYTMEAQSGNTFSLAELQSKIEEVRPKVLFIVHGESSTGVYQPLEGLGDICRRFNCLLAVDTVASSGGIPLFTDRWKIDAIYSGTQKVLGAPPGLAPISFSPRAQEVIFTRKTPVTVFYWDMTVLGRHWNCFNNGRTYHHTVPINLLYGLRESLAMIAEEGLENVIRRHRECANTLCEGVKKLGLELFVKDESKRLATVTTIVIPRGMNWNEVIANGLKRYATEITGGLGPTAGKVFRVGLMGYNASQENVATVLKILSDGLGLKSNL